jgi:hypothetical protein
MDADEARRAFLAHVLVMHEPRREDGETYGGRCPDCPRNSGNHCPTYFAAWQAMKAEAQR